MQMRLINKTIPLITVLALLGACGGSPEPEDEVTADGSWQDLLMAGSLDGWNVLGDANWHFEDSAVAADQSSENSYLVSQDSYGDFELELEFWVTTDANSGVFLRCANPAEVTDTSCYEVNIFDTRPDQTYRTGGIVNIAEPSEFIYTGGQWNRYRIRAEGSHMTVELNGRALVDTEDDQLASGPFALQYGMGTVKFRNVRIRSL